MARKEMFDFACRRMKIQEDTFYTTRQREWDRFRSATVNGQKKKERERKFLVPVSRVRHQSDLNIIIHYDLVIVLS